MKKILVIDGQGGGMGRLLVEALKAAMPELRLTAIGTNALATAAMLRAGADEGATGENPIVYNCADADLILGPFGIVIANALLGEVTPAMARAVGESDAEKLLLPVSRCRSQVVGVTPMTTAEYVRLAVEAVRALLPEPI